MAIVDQRLYANLNELENNLIGLKNKIDGVQWNFVFNIWLVGGKNMQMEKI